MSENSAALIFIVFVALIYIGMIWRLANKNKKLKL